MSVEDLGGLVTEASDPRYADLDRMSVAELARTMNEADATVPAAVERALPQIVPAIEAAAERMSRGGRLVYIGAGTPGRIGVLDASECPPTFSTPPELVFAIMAGGPGAIDPDVVRALAGRGVAGPDQRWDAGPDHLAAGVQVAAEEDGVRGDRSHRRREMIHGKDDDAGRSVLQPGNQEPLQRPAVEDLVTPLGEIVAQLPVGDDA